MNKRVLQLIGSFHQGGSERQAVALFRLLQQRGNYDVSIATLNKVGVLLDEFSADERPAIPEYSLTSFFRPSFVLQARRFAGHLRKNKIALVHSHDFYSNIFAMVATSLAGVKHIASKRETGGMRTRMQNLIEKAALSRAEAIVVNSLAVREYLVSRKIDGGKLNVIYNGLDLARFDHDRQISPADFGLPNGGNEIFVVLVANLRHDVKNISMLVRVASRMREKHPNVHFAIAGEGELLDGLQREASEVSVAEHVHFIGRCTDVPALLSIAHACVLTSTAEGFSNSILEYMAASRPVVVTDVGGARETVENEKTGFIVPSNDDKAMAERLIELLEDKPLAARLGTAARQHVARNFSADAQLEQTIALYDEMMSA